MIGWACQRPVTATDTNILSFIVRVCDLLFVVGMGKSVF